VRLGEQRLWLEAAVKAGVKLFFADEYVSDIRNPAYVAMPAQYVGDKIAVRAVLEERSKGGEICWTALNGGPFFDMCEWIFGSLHLWNRGSGWTLMVRRAHERACGLRYPESPGQDLRQR
jgi:hypothetical protein